MRRFVSTRRLLIQKQWSCGPRHHAFSAATAATASNARAIASDPLRILFCGSDDFSCASLRALHKEHERGGGTLVESIQAMVLPPKRTGRGFKELRQVPCKMLAEELGLRVHQRETFRGWELPEDTNLIIAVSFGLFVPPRILRAAKYGGLNMHPSLLPDLRGPAPIHHAMLQGREHIGISLQTLDDKRFDHGTVLAQTPSPGIPIRPDQNIGDATRDAAAVAAQMLVKGLRDGLYLPPHRDVARGKCSSHQLMHAPKLSKADSRVDWLHWTTPEAFRRRLRVFGAVWTRAIDTHGVARRLILRGAEPVAPPILAADAHACTIGTLNFAQAVTPGEAGAQSKDPEEEGLVSRAVALWHGIGAVDICLDDGADTSWLRLTRAQVESGSERDAATVLRPFVQPKL